MKKATASMLLLVLAFIPRTFGVESPIVDFLERRREVAAMMESATVWIVVEDDDSIASGTGFIVGDGCIATNAHVVDGMGKNVTVYVLNSRIPSRKARIVKTVHEDKESNEAVSARDFALLRFDPPVDAELPALSFSFDVKRMDRVSAWGYPAMATQFDISTKRLREGDTSNLEPPPVIYTEGTVNAIVRDDLGDSILHSASIAGGNSGGPLVNGRGEVVGMNTWGYAEEAEGAFLNGAQMASELAQFLMDNGVTPRLAAGQRMMPAVRDEKRPSPGERASSGETGEARRGVGSFSLIVPPGWSVLDEEEDMILVGAEDDSSAVGVMIRNIDAMSLRQAATILSEELDGTEPEEDDGLYMFSFSDEGIETLAVVGESDDDDRYVMVFVSGDWKNPQVEEILNSME